MNIIDQALFRAAIEADDAWGRELFKVFGNAAGDARYQSRGKGEPASALRAAHDAFRKANAAWMERSADLVGIAR